MRIQSPRFLTFIFSCLLLGTIFSVSAAPAWGQDEHMPAAEQAAGHEEMGAAAHEAPAAEAVGFPQLKTDTYATQVFWLFVSFIVLYVLMSQVALPKVGTVIDKRQDQRTSDLNRATAMQEEAEKIKIAYDKSLAEAQERAQAALSAAEQDINETNTAENSRFGEHARKRIASAEQSIAKAKNDALQSLSDISADIAVDMVSKIAGVQVTKADAKKAVTAAMQEGR